MGDFFKKNDFTPFALKLILKQTEPNYSKTREMYDFWPNVMGRFGAYESVDKSSDGKEYPYVGYYDKWDNKVVSWLGGKAPELAGKIYYDPETKEPLNPQPVIGVDQAYRSYVDSLNNYLVEHKDLKEYKFEPSLLGRAHSLGRAFTERDVPSNVGLYYAREPQDHGIEWGELLHSWGATPTWGRTMSDLGTEDLPLRAELHAAALGVPGEYRKQHYESNVPVIDNNHFNVIHRKPQLRVSYYKPRGHTGKGDFPYYFAIPENTYGKFLQNYFAQRNVMPTEEALSNAALFYKLTENKKLGLGKYRPDNYDKPAYPTDKVPVYTTRDKYKMTGDSLDQAVYRLTLDYDYDTDYAKLGKHWYSPNRWLTAAKLGLSGIVSWPLAQFGANFLDEDENKKLFMDENYTYDRHPWQPYPLAKKSKVTHYFE